MWTWIGPIWQTIAFGVGCALALAFGLTSMRRRRNLDLVFMAVLFAGTFIESNLVFYDLGPMLSYRLQPVDDVAGAFVAFILLTERFEDWKLGLIFLATLKMTATAAFWWSGGLTAGHGDARLYGLLIQAGFALELATLICVGVGGAGARRIWDWVARHDRAAVAHASASAKVRHY